MAHTVKYVKDPVDGSPLLNVTTRCPQCHGTNLVKCDPAGYSNWAEGDMIQDALPYLSADEREMLMTGICPDCWDSMFGE